MQAEYAEGFFRNAQRRALKAKYGNDGYWDLTDETKAQEWDATVANVLNYLDGLDAAEMNTGEASALIDALKNGNVVAMYWQSQGVDMT